MCVAVLTEFISGECLSPTRARCSGFSTFFHQVVRHLVSIEFNASNQTTQPFLLLFLLLKMNFLIYQDFIGISKLNICYPSVARVRSG